MNNYEFKLQVMNKLKQVQSARMINSDQIVLRCPLCGDSKKSLTKARFYVKINLKADEPILYHCFNCECSGILTPSILRSLKINDLQINSGLLRYNNSTIGKVNKSLGIKNNDFNFLIPRPQEDEKTVRKLDYINKRLGTNMSIDELVRLKVIFNLGEFLKVNEIENITVKKEQALLLHNEYVGFLTAKNEFINFRDITGKNKRYVKYSIFKNLENTRKMYVIPNNIDLLSTKRVTINLAEGVFDILSIWNHIYDRETDNIVYSAVCGSGYITVVKYFLQMGLFGDVDINIYSDNDHEPSFYKDMIKEVDDWINKVTLYYNDTRGEKDFGVSKDKISITRKRL